VFSTTPARRILIVDDDARITDVLRMMLEGFGYTTEVALTADDALTKAAAFHPDLVLLDAGMPGLLDRNSQLFTRRCRRRPRSGRIGP
jgi:CheY-like chemotaxis protein